MQKDRPFICLIGLLLLLGGRPGVGRAETEFLPAAQLDEIDGQTRSELSLFERYVQQRQWPEAIDIVRKLTDTNSSQIVLTPARLKGFDRGSRLSEHLHARLAQLSEETPELLAEFRFRTDTHAERLYRLGVQHHDADKLRQLRNDYLPGSFGDDALLLLGEIALAKGHYQAARRIWRQLHRELIVDYASAPASGPGRLWDLGGPAGGKRKAADGLSHPDSDIPLHVVRSRLIFASILEGDIERAKAELLQFARLHPGASGRLGGRTVDLNAELAVLIDSFARRKRITKRSWTTFGSNAQRRYLGEARIAVRQQPAWRIKLPQTVRAKDETETEKNLFFKSAKLNYHPIVVDDAIFFCNGQAIFGHDVKTGKPISWADPVSGKVFDLDPAVVFATREHDQFTLTESNSILYAQLGAKPTQDQESTQAILGIDLKAEGRLAFDPIRPFDKTWSFNGCPLAEGERFYFVKSKESGVIETYVACHENANEVWQRKICTSEMSSHNQGILLSLYEDTIYVNTNRGVVAALDKQNGQIRWMVRYPRTRFSPVNLAEQPWFQLRSPNPCIVAGGMIIVAPSDCEKLFALDSQTGRLIWSTDVMPGSFDAVELVGITGNRLIASGRRLWWIDRFTGIPTKTDWDNPFPRALHLGLKGHGRGLISAGQVLWPTRAQQDLIYTFDAESGQRHRQPINLSAVQVGGGHLLLTSDRLIIANETEIVAFEIVR